MLASNTIPRRLTLSVRPHAKRKPYSFSTSSLLSLRTNSSPCLQVTPTTTTTTTTAYSALSPLADTARRYNSTANMISKPQPGLEVETLTNEIQKLSAEDFKDDENARAKLLREAQKLCLRLETPWEFVGRYTFQEPTFLSCMKIADDISLFTHLGSASSPSQSTTTLSTKTGVEQKTLKRVLRHLAARGVITESSDDSYGPTPLSSELSTQEASSGIRHVNQVYTQMHQNFPAYLQSQDYQAPNDGSNGAFQACLSGHPGEGMFQYFALPGKEHHQVDFNDLMRYMTKGRRSWMEVSQPAHIIENADPEKPLLIDIGGGNGTDVMEFKQRFPQAVGTVELQEIPGVIASAKKDLKLDEMGITLREHDFFTPQPVHGARIYFMGSVLHDWPDHKAKEILSNVVPAMTKGYSRLMLSENVLPRVECHPHLSGIDLTMMTLLAARERSEEDWTALVESCGLKVVKVHTIPACLKSVVECELA